MMIVSSSLLAGSSANAQYLDALNALIPTGTDGASYSWTDPTLGIVTATWSGTTIGPLNAYNSTTRGDGSFLIRDATTAAPNDNSDDVKLTFSWDNSVTSFDLSIADWDAASVGPDILSFGNVTAATIIGRGDLANDGFHLYTAPGDNTLEYRITSDPTGAVGDNLPNSNPGNEIRVSLTNGGVGFTSFSVEHTAGSDNFYVGGPTSVPEPSSLLIIGLASLAGIARRGR